MRIGIDLGGTKIEIAALAPDGAIAWRKRMAAPQGSYDATLGAIRGLVAEADAFTGTALPVGIGIPGTISPATGLVKGANSTWLIGGKLDGDLAHMLERPVRLANDANCFALSEAMDGAGQGQNVVFGVIAGTGIGGGVVAGGRVLTGRNAIAGEWGHNPLPWPRADEWPGPLCYCGKHGCIEAFLSGPAFAAEYARATGKQLEPKFIAAAGLAGDAEAAKHMTRYCDRFARALASLVNILDPDAVVLGGGMSNIDALYSELPDLLPRYVFSDVCTTPILKNKHGDSSGVRGAAWLWPESATVTSQ